MISLVISPEQSFRTAQCSAIIAAHANREYIVCDDTQLAFEDLAQFATPSLFATAPLLVHAKFFLGDSDGTEATLAALAASDTIFLFEEYALAAPLIKKLQSLGATVAQEKAPAKSAAARSTIFSATECLTATDKKSRWLAYRSAMNEHAIEAVLPILYWKLRTLIGSDRTGKYRTLYRDLISAQECAWTSGAPLEVLVEKVILQS